MPRSTVIAVLVTGVCRQLVPHWGHRHPVLTLNEARVAGDDPLRGSVLNGFRWSWGVGMVAVEALAGSRGGGTGTESLSEDSQGWSRSSRTDGRFLRKTKKLLDSFEI